MKLVDLSNELIRIGFPDMFDFQMDGDIIVEFKITKLDEEEA